MRTPERPPNVSEAYSSPDFGEALSSGNYWPAVRSAEAKYKAWHQLKYVGRAEGLNPEILWALVKSGRKSRYRYLPLYGEGDNLLRFTTPDILQEELMRIDQQLAGQLASPDDQPLSVAHHERFMVNAFREEAIASSMLEGAATTRRDAKEMLRSGRKPKTVGERMVANNYHGMNFVREHRSEPLTPELLLQLQAILTDGTLANPDECGRFRTTNDVVDVVDQYGTIIHTPPSANELTSRLNQLCAFANGSSVVGFVHPVIRACVLHFQLGFDHPFCDGNGRTARLVFYWAMLRAGYWLFEYLPISRLIYAGPSKYARAFIATEMDEFDVTYFLAYKARLISRARKELGEYIERKQEEMRVARQVFESDIRLNHRQRDIIVRMLRSPSLALTIQAHQARHAIAYGTAHADLFGLVTWRYLTAGKVGGKQYEFVRGPVLLATDADADQGFIREGSIVPGLPSMQSQPVSTSIASPPVPPLPLSRLSGPGLPSPSSSEKEEERALWDDPP